MKRILHFFDEQWIYSQVDEIELSSSAEASNQPSNGFHFITMNSRELLFFMLRMIAIACILSGILLKVTAQAQTSTTLTGKVTDEAGQVLPGSNVYLLNTLDGTSTNSEGTFSFQTTESGNHILVVSSLGYQALNLPVQLNGQVQSFELKLKGAVSQLNEVVISAGAFEATNERAVAILRPMDIATTAGAGADIAAAIQTLPGTQRVGEQTGLFVRGGDASESLTIIDGMVVQNAFQSSVPGVAQRSRFTPWQFKGISFSSGGYSARYGQALSSVLELTTLDLPEKSTVNVGVNMAGVSAGGAKVWKNSSVEVLGNYVNLSPFYRLAKTNFDFYQVPQGGGASGRWVMKNGEKGLLKVQVNHSFNKSGTEIPNPEVAGQGLRFGLRNENSYVNGSYRHVLTEKLSTFTAVSLSRNQDHIQWDTTAYHTQDWRVQSRAEVAYAVSVSLNLLAGVEFQRFSYRQVYDSLTSSFGDSQLAGYIEADWKPYKWLAFKPGVRFENSHLLGKQTFGPRLSAAVRTGNYSQVSVASGLFYQNANNRYLLRGYHPGFQQAIHYIANYQWLKNDRTFRVEGYYKSYQDLIREKDNIYNPNQYRYVYGEVDNSGNGYAKGLDFFWRDKALVKNLDYWVSYSIIDSKRLYENFPAKATPNFLSSHNLNLITKYFIEKLQLSFGVSYNYASGRPYYNPDQASFLVDKGPAYHNLAINAAYLHSFGRWFTVFYLSLDNVTNQKNVFGYRYSPDGAQRYPIQPPLYRSVFAGVNLSLSQFKKDEL
jgi:outer membrane cobalamin receptor